jgi:hypothetical protein
MHGMVVVNANTENTYLNINHILKYIKMENFIKITVVILLCSVWQNNFAQSVKEIKFKEYHLEKTIKKKPACITFISKIDTLQKLSPNGLKFSIKLKNDSTENLEIRNPLDFMIIGLIDEAGVDVYFPEISRLLINEKGPHVYKSFEVERITKNAKEVLDLDISNAKTIVLPPKGELEIFYKIKIALKSNAKKPYTENETEQLKSGIYKFIMYLAIAPQKTDLAYMQLRIPLTTIYYGKNPVKPQ